MLWKLLVALWAVVLVTLITVTVGAAGAGPALRSNNGTQHQTAKPRFGDIKLQTGMAQEGPVVVRGSGYFQVRDEGG